jgi:hypothetical protein
VGRLGQMIEGVRKCEEASYKYLRPELFSDRYAIIDMWEKIKATAGPETVLQPVRMVVQEEPGEAESDDVFVKRMMALEVQEGELDPRKDWMRVYSRYIKSKDAVKENDWQLDVS